MAPSCLPLKNKKVLCRLWQLDRIYSEARLRLRLKTILILGFAGGACGCIGVSGSGGSLRGAGTGIKTGLE